MNVIFAAGFATAGSTFAALAFLLVTVALFVLAVWGSWNVTERLPTRGVTIALVAIGILVVLSLLLYSALVAMMALVALFAGWIWFFARYVALRVPVVVERLSDPDHKEHEAELHASQAEQAKRGDALESVLGAVMREEHPEDIAAVESTETDND